MSNLKPLRWMPTWLALLLLVAFVVLLDQLLGYFLIAGQGDEISVFGAATFQESLGIYDALPWALVIFGILLGLKPVSAIIEWDEKAQVSERKKRAAKVIILGLMGFFAFSNIAIGVVISSWLTWFLLADYMPAVSFYTEASLGDLSWNSTGSEIAANIGPLVMLILMLDVCIKRKEKAAN